MLLSTLRNRCLRSKPTPPANCAVLPKPAHEINALTAILHSLPAVGSGSRGGSALEEAPLRVALLLQQQVHLLGFLC